LNAVRNELGAPLFDELLGHIADDGQKLRSIVQAAPDDGCRDRFDAALHSLKGAASTLGLAGVAKMAQDMRDVEHPDDEAVNNLIDLITSSIARVSDEISKAA